MRERTKLLLLVAAFGAAYFLPVDSPRAQAAFLEPDPAEVAEMPASTTQTNDLTVMPNPFRDATSIRYALERPEAVTIRIYDATGSCVRTLARGERREIGEQWAVWDGRSDAGAPVSSGAYYVRVDAGSSTTTSRMILAR